MVLRAAALQNLEDHILPITHLWGPSAIAGLQNPICIIEHSQWEQITVAEDLEHWEGYTFPASGLNKTKIP